MEENTMRNGSPSAYMSVREASKYLTLSERTIRSLLADGTINAIRKGRRIILRQDELDRFMEGGETNV